jgi:hypothetical protein
MAKKKPAAPPVKKRIGRPPAVAAQEGTAAGMPYKLQMVRGAWEATVILPSTGKPRVFPTDTPNAAVAHARTKLKVEQVVRGLKMAERRNRQADEAAAALESVRRAAAQNKPAGEDTAATKPPPVVQPAAPPAAPPAAAAAAETDQQRAERIAAKLRGIGDAQPIKPDGIFPAGDADPDSEAGEAENEDELFADTAAMFLVMGTLAVPKAILRSRRPPLKPGRPDPWSLEAYTKGLQQGCRRLMGSAALGPVGKTVAGAIGIMISMFVGAEPMNPQHDGTAAQPAAAAPPSPPVPPAAPPNAETALAVNGQGQMGRFR